VSANFRSGRAYLSEVGGKVWRVLGEMISRRQVYLPDSDGDRMTALGRESLDPDADEDTRQEANEMDMFGSVGLIGRPKDAQTVEAIVVLLGGQSTHPVAVATLDKTRRDVVATVGLAADETLVYTSATMVKLSPADVRLGSQPGPHQPLAFKSDADSLNARISALEAAVNTFITAYNAHTHSALSSPPLPPGVPAATAATVVGTSKTKAD
jgi:hypothetical protein